MPGPDHTIAVVFSPKQSNDRSPAIREISRIPDRSSATQIAFSPDGRARIWIWRTEDRVADACTRFTCNLTQTEWQQCLGDVPHLKTCAKLP